METSPVPTKIAFEKNYSDGSGVEYAVRLDTTKTNMVDGGPVLEFEHVGSVEFPINELDWLIDCLMRIKAEVRPNAADKISALASRNEELRGALAAIQNKAHAARPADYGTALAVIAAWAGKELSLPPNA